ncbi:hypothetical protein QZM22_20360 [Burkholderia oklahomensis]|uniref:hypothetical protein n=1 Tax=Burkholderia oklahomensis TaxID=342113 RepID=UPI002653E424|nr:hypothetical protein [Burkholderia oklahomensis]MDN7674812.1 hypothetical protein [Burkholderia oklahomensis]
MTSRNVTWHYVASRRSRRNDARRPAIERRRRTPLPPHDIANERARRHVIVERRRLRVEPFATRADVRHRRIGPCAEPDPDCVAIIEMQHVTRLLLDQSSRK